MRLKRPDIFTGDRVPELYEAAFIAAREQPAIRRESHGAQLVVVLQDSLLHLSRLLRRPQVPQDYGLVSAARGQQSAIRRKGHAGDMAGVTFQFRGCPQTRQVPDPHLTWFKS